jgi:quercetin dioxygenase-like cupin family protein
MPSFDTSVLLRSEDSAGQVGMVVNTVPAGWAGPPLHHHDFDEAFYVLAGRLTFQLGDVLRPAGPGALVFAPRGSVHTLANHGDTEARYLLVITPGGFERYFDRMAAEPPASASKPYPETIVVGPQIDPAAPLGEPVAAPGGRIRVLLHGEQSDAAVSIMDNDIPADVRGPFLHTHAFAEAFYVSEGELTFQLDDELVTVGAGELAFAPPGVPHTFANRSGAPARFVLVCTPAGFERHFARLAAKQAGVEPPDWALGPIPEVTRVGPQIGDDYGRGRPLMTRNCGRLTT